MKSRRLVVLTYHFPPDGAVGGLRWAALSKYLVRSGWEVHVITAAEQNTTSDIPGVHIHHVPRRDTLDVIYKRRLEGRPAPPQQTSSGPAVSPESTKHPAPLSFIGKLRRVVAESLIVPDYARGWLLRAAAHARALDREHHFDVLLSSGPPHSVHLAGRLAVVGTRMKRVVDMRDPWVPVDPGFRAPEASLQYAMLPALESTILSGTAMVIANTPPFKQSLESRYPRANVEWVPNGIDLERLPAPSTHKFEGLSIAYAGTLYLERNLSSVLRAIDALFKAHPETRGKCVLRVAGNMDGPHASAFLGEVQRLALNDSVIALGSLSSKDALDLINRSQLALVLAQNQPVQVPAKLYECVALNVPTLVLTETASAAASEARRIGALTCEPSAVDEIQRMLEQLLAGEITSSGNTALFSYDALAAKLGRLLEGLITG